MKFKLNLQMFGEGGAAAGGEASAAPAAENLENVVYGKQAAPIEEAPEPEPETKVTSGDTQAREADFEKLIKGDYKAQFDQRVQKIIDSRFKQTKEMESRLSELSPVLDMLASKYGVDAKDAKAIAAALEADDSYYEDEALERGLTVAQLKEIKQIERENAQLKAAQQRVAQKQEADRVYADWMQQGEQLKQIYPTFDFRQEALNPEFAKLLQANVPVRTAYEVIHRDEIIGGAMQYTAQQIQQKTINDIRARGQRPAENGAASRGSGIVTKPDPSKWTKADRKEIEKRVARGERIEL